MVNHSGENNEFKRLKKLGMKFEDGGDYRYQPDSGSTIGGGRGENEYGIRGGVARETFADNRDSLHPSDLDASVDGLSQREEQPTSEPIPLGTAAKDLPGVSEYTEDSAMDPEERIANLDALNPNPIDESVSSAKPRAKARAVKSRPKK